MSEATTAAPRLAESEQRPQRRDASAWLVVPLPLISCCCCRRFFLVVIYRCVQYNIYDLIQYNINPTQVPVHPSCSRPLHPPHAEGLVAQASAPATSLPGGACRASPDLLKSAAVTPALGLGRRALGTTPPPHARTFSSLACVATCHAAGEASEWVAQVGMGTGSSGEKQDPKSRRLVQTPGRLASKLASTGHQRVEERGHFPPSPQLYRRALPTGRPVRSLDSLRVGTSCSTAPQRRQERAPLFGTRRRFAGRGHAPKARVGGVDDGRRRGGPASNSCSAVV